MTPGVRPPASQPLSAASPQTQFTSLTTGQCEVDTEACNKFAQQRTKTICIRLAEKCVTYTGCLEKSMLLEEGHFGDLKSLMRHTLQLLTQIGQSLMMMMILSMMMTLIL